MRSKGKIEVCCVFCNKIDTVFKSRAINYKYCSVICMKKDYQGDLPKIGTAINNWLVSEDVFHRKNGRMYLKVKCNCGSNIEQLIPKHHLKSKKSVGCSNCSMFHTSKGYKRLSGDYWSMIISGAKKRNIEFSLTIEQAYEVIEKQKFKCALTGLDISFNVNTTQGKKIDGVKKTASLDRIDSKKGYYLDNIQWLHKDINIMKNKYNQDYFIKICKLICKKN